MVINHLLNGMILQVHVYMGYIRKNVYHTNPFLTSIFEGTQPSKNKALSSNQNKGPHLGSRYIYIRIYIYIRCIYIYVCIYIYIYIDCVLP